MLGAGRKGRWCQVVLPSVPVSLPMPLPLWGCGALSSVSGAPSPFSGSRWLGSAGGLGCWPRRASLFGGAGCVRFGCGVVAGGGGQVVDSETQEQLHMLMSQHQEFMMQ